MRQFSGQSAQGMVQGHAGWSAARYLGGSDGHDFGMEQGKSLLTATRPS